MSLPDWPLVVPDSPLILYSSRGPDIDSKRHPQLHGDGANLFPARFELSASDRFQVCAFSNRLLMAVADDNSCSPPVAETAVESIVSYVGRYVPAARRLPLVGTCLIGSLTFAHELVAMSHTSKRLRGSQFGSKESAGAMVGVGCLVELDLQAAAAAAGASASGPQPTKRWAFVFAAIGNCRAFHFAAHSRTVQLLGDDSLFTSKVFGRIGGSLLAARRGGRG